VDGTDNSGGMVTYEIECNLYYKRHIEQVKIDVYDLERIEVCYESPKKETVSYAFKHFIQNLKLYNGIKE